jgi:hypothetical protein
MRLREQIRKNTTADCDRTEESSSPCVIKEIRGSHVQHRKRSYLLRSTEEVPSKIFKVSKKAKAPIKEEEGDLGPWRRNATGDFEGFL